MDSALKALVEPNRRRILELVADKELTAGEISEHFEVTRPAISQHLTVLRQAGLIGERRQGTRRLYKARRDGFAQTRLFLEGFWDDRLGRLQRAAEEAQTGEISETISVERVIAIDAPVEKVWSLLVDPDEATRWMGQTAAFDVSPGGSYRVEVVPGQFAVGEFIEMDPPRRLVHTWGWEGDAGGVVPPGSTIVVMELLTIDDATLLRLLHRELPSIASAGSHSRGWGHYLQRLAALAAGIPPGPDPWATDPDRLFAELRPPTKEKQ